MPIYEYACDDCGQVIEILQKFSEKPMRKCPSCSGRVHKLISQSAFHLKGSGWYVTDYAGKSTGNDKQGADKTETKKDTVKKESKKADTSADKSS